MRAQVRKAWEARTPHERAVLVALAVVLLAAILVSFVRTASEARSRLRPSVTALHGQLAHLEEQAREIERLRAAPPVAASQSDLRALVQSRMGATLSGALVRVDALDADRVEVAFGAVSFSDWLNWLAGLKALQVRVAASRIESMSSPGLVSATATLERAKAR